MIVGAGLTLGGFGMAFLARDSAPKDRKPAHVTEFESAVPVDATKPVAKDYNQKFSSYTSQLSIPTGMLGVLFLGLGWALRWIIRNNIDDGDEPIENHELFKAYAQQLVVAERLKTKNRKRLP